MTHRRITQSLLFCFLLVTAGCHKPRSPSQTPPDRVNLVPGAPTIDLAVSMRSKEEAYVAVRFLAKSTDAENDKIAYTFAWFRNGEPMTFPTTQTDTVTKLGPDINPDPFAVDTSDITWKVVVTPRDAYGTGASAATSVKIVLKRGCEMFHRGYILVDCKGEYRFSTPLTDSIAVAENSRIFALQNVIAQEILGADGTPGHSRFRNFTDLLLKRAFSRSASAALPFDPGTYQYTGSPSAITAMKIFDRTCLDIPLVGSVCLHSYYYDVDNDPGFQMMDFGPVAASHYYGGGIPVSEATPSENGRTIVQSLGGDQYDVTIFLKASVIDLLFEPPVDSSIKDIPNNTPDYIPAMDLSTYLKAYGHAQLGENFELRFHVNVPSSFDHLDFRLRTFRMVGNDFQFVFVKGAYCNNNLGTTESPLAGNTHRIDPLERPFDSFGVPLFASLVSDTVTGNQSSDPLVSYYARENWPYPHIASNTQGGSGVGRDRIGVNTTPYTFDLAQGLFSDNPNNCVHPADACTVTGVQDGGVEWIGYSFSCEYPNISNNSDDSTYKTSEQITSIIPYIHGEIKVTFNHLVPW